MKNCQGQPTDNGYARLLLVDCSVLGYGFQYDNKPVGDRLGIGCRFGLTQLFKLNHKLTIKLKADYSQLGTKRFRVLPTGILDTVNVYNSLHIYEENVKLQYMNLRAGLMKTVWTNGSIDVFIGVNAFAGLLINGKYKGRELQGSLNYTTDASFIYQKFNYGFEPELGTIIHLSNGNSFYVSAAYELGIPNIYHPSNPPPKGSYSSEHTRAFSFTISFPFFSF